MRSKPILSVAAFVIAFAFSAAFASLFITKNRVTPDLVPVVSEYNSGYKSTGCFKYKNKSAAADKITALIRADKENGRASERSALEMSEGFISPFTNPAFPAYAEAVEQYVDDSSSMRTGRLPGDFQAAWREHMKAWRDYSEFLNRMKKSSVRSSWSSEEFQDIDAFHNREINRTWYEVLRIGKTYGADVSN